MIATASLVDFVKFKFHRFFRTMSGNHRNLAPDEIENALELLFGFTDGTRSEDEQKYSDFVDLRPLR